MLKLLRLDFMFESALLRFVNFSWKVAALLSFVSFRGVYCSLSPFRREDDLWVSVLEFKFFCLPLSLAILELKVPYDSFLPNLFRCICAALQASD